MTSVVREPGPFLRAFELMEGAGWNPAKDGPRYGRKLARELQGILTQLKVATQPECHRLLFEASEGTREPLLSMTLIVGFNAVHWPLWDLLRAVAQFSAGCSFGLLGPRVFGEAIDELFIGSWEECTGQSVEMTMAPNEERPHPFSTWVKSYEVGDSRKIDLPNVTFLITSRLRTQTEAVVLQALTFLENKSCDRLGIIFPEGSGLALGVAAELQRLGIPLDDGVGSLRPGPFEKRCWSAWLDLQEEPSIKNFIAWRRASEAEGTVAGEAPAAREMARVLEGALNETLVDDLELLRLHLEVTGKHPRLVEFLRTRVQLPESASFPEFRRLTLQALERLGWRDHFPFHEMEMPSWLDEVAGNLSRGTFLRWLREATDSRVRARGAGGNHYYSKVHLLHYAHLPGQAWTHLILTGLNEGIWPRAAEAGSAFGSRYELEQLNRQARGLNRRGRTEGAQGAGHPVVRAEHSHCLLPLERHELAVRDLCAAVEATSQAVCLCALSTEGGRPLLPSDFLLQAYRAKTGSALEEAAFGDLARQTEEEAARHQTIFRRDSTVEIPDLGETKRAYLARRDMSRAFGPYEFSYAEPPAEPVQLPCKTWEKAWNHPASIWFERVVGVAPWPEGELSWPLATGIWVHRWLASALHDFKPSSETKDFLARLRDSADKELHQIEGLMEQIGLKLYPWWKHVWSQARATALSLGEELAPQLRERRFLSEYPLPRNSRIALPGSKHADFDLRGQIDLLLIDPAKAPISESRSPDFTDAALWIIDFKTGSAKNLTASQMDKGNGLQAMLYALALEQFRPSAIALSLQTLESPLRPHAQLGEVRGCLTLFRSLERMHRQGVFGLRPKATEGEYGHTLSFPLATLPLPAEVIEAKWALTHGGFEALVEES